MRAFCIRPPAEQGPGGPPGWRSESVLRQRPERATMELTPTRPRWPPAGRPRDMRVVRIHRADIRPAVVASLNGNAVSYRRSFRQRYAVQS